MKNTHGGVLLILLKATLLHGCFSRVLNCKNDTKSSKASQITNGWLFLDDFKYRQDNLPKKSGNPSNLKTFCLKSK